MKMKMKMKIKYAFLFVMVLFCLIGVFTFVFGLFTPIEHYKVAYSLSKDGEKICFIGDNQDNIIAIHIKKDGKLLEAFSRKDKDSYWYIYTLYHYDNNDKLTSTEKTNIPKHVMEKVIKSKV